jgi:hypothetical protein
MHMMLAATKMTETFNADFYVTTVTVLPILMLAIEVLTNVEKLTPARRPSARFLPFAFLAALFYYFTPIIAAAGVILGALALIYRDTNAVLQWITFSCLAGVVGFLAISSTVYLIAFDNAQYKREREEEKARNTLNSSGPTS